MTWLFLIKMGGSRSSSQWEGILPRERWQSKNWRSSRLSSNSGWQNGRGNSRRQMPISPSLPMGSPMISVLHSGRLMASQQFFKKNMRPSCLAKHRGISKEFVKQRFKWLRMLTAPLVFRGSGARNFTVKQYYQIKSYKACLRNCPFIWTDAS